MVCARRSQSSSDQCGTPGGTRQPPPPASAPPIAASHRRRGGVLVGSSAADPPAPAPPRPTGARSPRAARLPRPANGRQCAAGRAPGLQRRLQIRHERIQGIPGFWLAGIAVAAQIDLVRWKCSCRASITGHHDCPRLPMPCSNTTDGFPGWGNSVTASGAPAASIVITRPPACGALVIWFLRGYWLLVFGL